MPWSSLRPRSGVEPVGRGATGTKSLGGASSPMSQWRRSLPRPATGACASCPPRSASATRRSGRCCARTKPGRRVRVAAPPRGAASSRASRQLLSPAGSINGPPRGPRRSGGRRGRRSARGGRRSSEASPGGRRRSRRHAPARDRLVPLFQQAGLLREPPSPIPPLDWPGPRFHIHVRNREVVSGRLGRRPVEYHQPHRLFARSDPADNGELLYSPAPTSPLRRLRAMRGLRDGSPVQNGHRRSTGRIRTNQPSRPQ